MDLKKPPSVFGPNQKKDLGTRAKRSTKLSL